MKVGIFALTMPVALLAFGPTTESFGQDKQQLAAKARTFLETHCHRCHGEKGSFSGNVNFILDRDKLVERKKIVPGDAAKSRLFRLVKDGDMPQDDKTTPSEAETAVLKAWIDAGAPDFKPAATASRAFISDADILKFILGDMEKKVPERERRFARYFTITHLYNAGLSDDELQTYRQGLSKLVNSLSWGRTIVKPLPVDPAQTILRIDLRALKWDDKVWNRILAANPYGLTHDTPTAKACYAATACELPYVRADWFVAAASKPPLYHEVLQLPKTDRELERELKVDVAADIEQENVVRAGFNGSGVSQNNRVIERHPSGHGAYWKSYDFANNVGRKNIFTYPLGPGTRQNAFQHDGGEIIFNLPNGMQAYLLVNSKGERIDVGPTKIVFDKEAGAKGRQPEVVNGISCMSCHYAGMKEKDDQILAHVEQNPNAFSKKDAEVILALYPPKEKFDEKLREDAERFRRAVEESGGQIGKSDPIEFLVQRFEEELDQKLAAAEAGVKTETLLDGIGRSQVLAPAIGPLKAGNTVKREVFVAAFPDIVRELRLGTHIGRREVPPDLEAVRRLARPSAITIITNSIGMKLVLIPAGEYMMGSPEPRHRVSITRPFYMGAYEVAQREYESVMRSNPSYFTFWTGGSQDHPVENVSWHDALEFCRRLSAMQEEKQAGRLYALPTEAQWEYACRAGTETIFHFGDSLSSIQANFNGKSPYGGAPKGPAFDKTCQVGSYEPNAFGLHDMHGNVTEWCADWYSKDYYQKSPAADPSGPSSGSERVLRGGCYLFDGGSCTSAWRSSTKPTEKNRFVGFRVIMVRLD